ncbi:unnamed protein product (mitochondrion) [Plasmodiophora brassicae]|uniref:Survival Motor Neuron Gemin2-binding domain-containing protein n=1 Tax=Plasmodiophora brassicae TaxID=37360 RepID=A0A3P3Y9S5_PLABS|nr:unnamed protein product [Plasmodiophora brassicae]
MSIDDDAGVACSESANLLTGGDWDDSALIAAFDRDVEDYQTWHGIAQEPRPHRHTPRPKRPRTEAPVVKEDGQISDEEEIEVNGAADIGDAVSAPPPSVLADAEPSGGSPATAAIPPPPQVDMSPDLYNALLAWYYAGYYAGRKQAIDEMLSMNARKQ